MRPERPLPKWGTSMPKSAICPGNPRYAVYNGWVWRKERTRRKMFGRPASQWVPLEPTPEGKP